MSYLTSETSSSNSLPRRPFSYDNKMCSIQYNEFECTVGIVFDNNLYGRIRHCLINQSISKKPSRQVVEIYSSANQNNTKYRTCDTTEPDGLMIKSFDSKRIVSCYEAQIPYLKDGRILFLTGTYKESVENKLTEHEWQRIKESENHHTVSSPVRISSKHREVFPPEEFNELAGSTVRVSIGEYSIYGGTMESRVRCNPINYMEMEFEFKEQPDERTVNNMLTKLTGHMVNILGYDLVVECMKAENTRSVRGEYIGCIFESFKRNFINYNYEPNRVAVKRGIENGDFAFFVMPKWDGVRATALYSQGHLLVESSFGKLFSIETNLPFDNDVILQLELLDRRSDIEIKIPGKFIIVITEIMAVLVKSHNTTYQMYGKNNAYYDTGRYAGNVPNSIVMTKQFKDPENVCNLYRLVRASTSIHIMEYMSKIRHDHLSTILQEDIVRNLEENPEEPVLMFTTVVRCTEENGNTVNTDILDTFFASNSIEDDQRHNEVRANCLETMTAVFPDTLKKDEIYCEYGAKEGIILVCTDRINKNVNMEVSSPYYADFSLPAKPLEYGYMKIKIVDTVDLELNGNGDIALSSDLTEYKVHGIPTSLYDGKRRIIECYRNRMHDGLYFLRIRHDKVNADNNVKIASVDTWFTKKM